MLSAEGTFGQPGDSGPGIPPTHPPALAAKATGTPTSRRESPACGTQKEFRNCFRPLLPPLHCFSFSLFPHLHQLQDHSCCPWAETPAPPLFGSVALPLWPQFPHQCKGRGTWSRPREVVEDVGTGRVWEAPQRAPCTGADRAIPSLRVTEKGHRG